MARAVELTMLGAAIATGADWLRRVVDASATAAFLIAYDRHILHANPAGEQLLRGQRGLVALGRPRARLHAADPADERMLAKQLDAARAAATGEAVDMARHVVVGRLAGQGPLVLTLVPLPPPSLALWENVSHVRILVLVADSEAAVGDANAQLLCQLFGLTQAEARTAILVASGLSVPQTAARLGTAPETVKAQLAGSYQKLGVHSQVGLARLVNGLPVTR